MKVNQFLNLLKEGYIGPHKNFTLKKPTFTCIKSECTDDCPAYRKYNCKFTSRHGVEVSHTAISKLTEQLTDYPEFFI